MRYLFQICWNAVPITIGFLIGSFFIGALKRWWKHRESPASPQVLASGLATAPQQFSTVALDLAEKGRQDLKSFDRELASKAGAGVLNYEVPKGIPKRWSYRGRFLAEYSKNELVALLELKLNEEAEARNYEEKRRQGTFDSIRSIRGAQ